MKDSHLYARVVFKTSNLEISHCFYAEYSGKMHAMCAAWFFFLFLSMLLLVFGIVIAIAVVVSKLPIIF